MSDAWERKAVLLVGVVGVSLGFYAFTFVAQSPLDFVPVVVTFGRR